MLLHATLQYVYAKKKGDYFGRRARAAWNRTIYCMLLSHILTQMPIPVLYVSVRFCTSVMKVTTRACMDRSFKSASAQIQSFR